MWSEVMLNACNRKGADSDTILLCAERCLNDAIFLEGDDSNAIPLFEPLNAHGRWFLSVGETYKVVVLLATSQNKEAFGKDRRLFELEGIARYPLAIEVYTTRLNKSTRLSL